jgi:hypothetical protein
MNAPDCTQAAVVDPRGSNQNPLSRRNRHEQSLLAVDWAINVKD